MKPFQREGEGPRHFGWRFMRWRLERLRREIQAFNDDLASIKEFSPGCSDLRIEPIADIPPALPPEPAVMD